ncbi:MAG: hypothetical protein ABI594_15990 [Ginsengibacter sp.]
MGLILYAVYTFLAAYNAGNMMTLQIQHYGIYPFVGKENFKTYMVANNKAALIPSVMPGLIMLILSIILFFVRPSFVTSPEVIFFLVLNVVVFISTFRWQRKLQSEMASEGYDESKIKLLISTNWIRAIAFIFLGVSTNSILVMAVS